MGDKSTAIIAIAGIGILFVIFSGGNVVANMIFGAGLFIFVVAVVVMVSEWWGRMQDQGAAYDARRVNQSEDNAFLQKWADGKATPEDRDRYEARQERKRQGGY